MNFKFTRGYPKSNRAMEPRCTKENSQNTSFNTCCLQTKKRLIAVCSKMKTVDRWDFDLKNSNFPNTTSMNGLQHMTISACRKKSVFCFAFCTSVPAWFPLNVSHFFGTLLWLTNVRISFVDSKRSVQNGQACIVDQEAEIQRGHCLQFDLLLWRPTDCVERQWTVSLLL